MAKYRSARALWADRLRNHYGARIENSWKLRFHAQTAGCSLQDKQPEVNLIRVAYQALAAVLGGCQSLHTNSMDETLALPSEHAVTLALRTQQVLAHETGVTNTVDPLGGSYFVETLTRQMQAGSADHYFDRIDALGGMLSAIDRGFFRREIAEAAFAYQREFDAKATRSSSASTPTRSPRKSRSKSSRSTTRSRPSRSRRWPRSSAMRSRRRPSPHARRRAPRGRSRRKRAARAAGRRPRRATVGEVMCALADVLGRCDSAVV